MLHIRRLTDAPSAPTLVALHGFTLTGEMFRQLGEWIPLPLIAPDLPGHGASPPATDATEAIEGVAEVLRGLASPPVLLGYSMGGRIALSLALSHPDLLSGLVLVSSGPGLVDGAVRRERLRDDLLMADRMDRLSIGEFIDDWLTGDVVAPSPDVDVARHEADRNVRLENDTQRLAGALRALGQGTLEHNANRLGELAVPVLLVSGRRDRRYSKIMEDMVPSIPSAEHVTIDNAGHNVVFDAPEALAVAINRAFGV